MKKYQILLILGILFIVSCETYPDWKEYVSYSSVYPICGEYLVKDYDEAGTVTENDYALYIYNKAYNPTGDSIWIDNSAGHPSGSNNYLYKFKIKTKADTVNLTFNTDKAGVVYGSNPNPQMNDIRVTISDSKIFRLAKDITDPTPDSIYFKFTIFESDLTTVKVVRIVKGHRKTGWEHPNYDDVMF